MSAERVPTKQLFPDWNLRTSSFEEEGTDVGEQDNKSSRICISQIISKVVD